MLQPQYLRQRISERLPEGLVTPEHTSDGHFYRVQGQNMTSVLYPSVTAKLQILKDEGLMNWKMNQAIEYVSTHWATAQSEEALANILKDARQSPVDIFEDAGDIGSAVHGYREKYFNNDFKIVATDCIPEDEYDVRSVSCMRALESFVLQTGYQPIACELPLYSHELKLGGTLDDIGLIDGKLVLMDLKTSNQLKDSYWAQVALYRKMFVSLTGLRPARSFILRLSKTDGTYQIEELKDITAVTKWAVHVVQASNGLGMVKELRKRERITL